MKSIYILLSLGILSACSYSPTFLGIRTNETKEQLESKGFRCRDDSIEHYKREICFSDATGFTYLGAKIKERRVSFDISTKQMIGISGEIDQDNIKIFESNIPFNFKEQPIEVQENAILFQRVFKHTDGQIYSITSFKCCKHETIISMLNTKYRKSYK